MKVAISETTEQLLEHIKKFDAQHPEIKSEQTALEAALAERFGEADAADLLHEATLNSIRVARDRNLLNPKKNPFIETTTQTDLFDDVPEAIKRLQMVGVKVPSEVKTLDGDIKPYYEATAADVLPFWQARESLKSAEVAALEKARIDADAARMEAHKQVHHLLQLQEELRAVGLDLTSVRYAKTT